MAQAVPIVIEEIEGKSFRWLFDTAADALLVVDRDGRVLLANPVTEALFGYTRPRLTTLHVEDLMPERFRTRHHQLRAGFFNDPKPRYMTNALKSCAVRADGSEFAADVKLAPIGEGQVLVSVHDASARYHAEQALQSSEDQLKLLVAGVKDYAIFMLDPEGNVVTWNDGAQRIKGYSPDEIIGRHFSVFFPDDEIRAGKPQQILTVTRRDGRFEEESLRVRKDGSSFFAHATMTALYDGHGELRGYGKVTRDITQQRHTDRELEDHRRRLQELVTRRTTQLERQAELLRAANANLSKEVSERMRTEAALRESERRYREIFENASDNVFLMEVTKDGRFRNIEANPAFEKSLGVPVAEFPGKYIEETVPPETARRIIARLRECVQTGIVLEHEMELEVPTGLRIFRATLIPVRDTAGRIHRIIGVSRDITERKQAESALRDSEARFRLLLNSAGEGIYGLDDEGRCTFVNDAAVAMLGRTREELIGRDTHGLIHHTRADGTTYPAEDCPIYDAFRRGVSCRGVTVMAWRKDGTWFPAEYSAQPLRRDTAIIGAVLVFRDVTEQQALTRWLSHQATHDALTGLVNRTEFERRLERIVNDSRRGNRDNALCYIDLDHFKAINDTCGHAAGDQVLQQVSHRLLERVRARDTLARIGGDEFGVLLEHCPFDQAQRIANDLLSAVENFRFDWEGQSFPVGLSIGLIPLTAESGDLATIMHEADIACYAAKQLGRHRVFTSGPGDASAAEPALRH
jgi:diguanylate cyclase (GGDEF)-like protein/PAS domain S-box-containing protein